MVRAKKIQRSKLNESVELKGLILTVEKTDGTIISLPLFSRERKKGSRVAKWYGPRNIRKWLGEEFGKNTDSYDNLLAIYEQNKVVFRKIFA